MPIILKIISSPQNKIPINIPKTDNLKTQILKIIVAKTAKTAANKIKNLRKRIQEKRTGTQGAAGSHQEVPG